MGLNVHAVSRAFGSVRAVNEVSFSVEPGQVIGMVGPNGCGKTTTMLMMVGLLQPDTGWIDVDGNVVVTADPSHAFSQTQAAAGRALMGWMPDQFGSWDALTTEEILTRFAKIYGLANPAARVAEVIDAFNLQEFSGRRIHTLSRGQKQRLGFARALIHRPRYLILDEPANGMDPRARRDLRTFVRTYAQTGAGVVISSHILTELDDMVDDAIFMRAGRRVEAAPQSLTSRWDVTALNLDAWREFTRHFAPTQGVTFTDDAFTAPSNELAGEIIAQACAAGVRFTGVAPARHDLESRYLAMEEQS